MKFETLGELVALVPATQLNLPDNFWLGSFTRHGGCSPPPYVSLNTGLSTNDDELNIVENIKRIRFAKNMGEILIAALSHSDDIHHHSTTNQSSLPQVIHGVDGILSSVGNCALMLSTADCIPLAAVDIKSSSFGIFHIGRVGLQLELAMKCVRKFLALGSTAENLRFWIGPCIRSCCYEIKSDSWRKIPQFERHISVTDDQRITLDLAEAVREQIMVFGVPKESIVDSRHCTSCDNQNFFSHRHCSPVPTGRFGTVILRKDSILPH